MALNWRGPEVRAKVIAAAADGIDATMAAAILHAKSEHGAGAHALQRFESHTGELERSVRIVEPAREVGRAVRGLWGSVGLGYARRIELGFQGKDSLGRAYDAPPFPFLRPAAEAEYPKLADRIRRAFGGA